MARIVGKRRQQKLDKLNQSAKRKASRLQKQYNIDVELEVRTASSFNSIKDYNQYIRGLERFTDRKTHRYTKLANDTVIDYSLFLDWRRGQRQLNRQNKKALEKRLKIANSKYTYDDLVDDPFKAHELNLEWLLPGDTSMKTFKNKYMSRYSVNRNIEATQEKADGDYANTRDQQFKDNFVTAIDTYFIQYFRTAGVDIYNSAHAFKDFVDNLSLSQFLQVYYGMGFDPFEFVYTPDALIEKYNRTVDMFRKHMTPEEYDLFYVNDIWSEEE